MKRNGTPKPLPRWRRTLEGAHRRALADAKTVTWLLPWNVGGERIGK